MASIYNQQLAVMRKWFFDRARVQRAVDRATGQVLSRFGAYVRTRAKTSMRKRKGKSPVGTPPYVHVGTLRNAVLFAYDPNKKSVVIGPIQAGHPSQGHGARVEEYGGQLINPRLRKGRLLTYPPRPFMTPAFNAELPAAVASFHAMVKP